MTKDAILSKLSEKDLWRKYYGDYVLGKMYHSPFRKDSRPSFGLYQCKTGRILYKDFGLDGGDIFQFIQTKFNISFKDTLLLIESDFKLSSTNYRPKTYQHLYSFADKLVKKEPAKFAYEVKVFDEPEFAYWAQFGINPEILFEYNVFSVRMVKGETWNHIIESTKDNPVFCYKYPSGNIRFYRPLAKKWELKHFGNSNAEDIFGYEQLYRAVHDSKATESITCITAGQKDALSLYSNTQIRSISLNSESAILTKETYLKLLSLSKVIEIAYDMDKTGRTNSDKIVKEYGIHDYMQNFYLTGDMKDISDYFKNLHKQKV